MTKIFIALVCIMLCSAGAPVLCLGAAVVVGVGNALSSPFDPCLLPIRPPGLDCPDDDVPGDGAPIASGTAQEALRIAESLKGTPYQWGGTNPRTGLDCSGYTQLVLRQVGINIPRTSRQQQAFLPQTTSPRPGDLVFFGSPVHHVGIYAGNGKMWHAPQTGDVVKLSNVWHSELVRYGRVPYPPTPSPTPGPTTLPSPTATQG